jgi:hypothetical protein
MDAFRISAMKELILLLLIFFAVGLIVFSFPYVFFRKVKWSKRPCRLAPFVTSFRASYDLQTKYRISALAVLEDGISVPVQVYPVWKDNQFTSIDEAKAKSKLIKDLAVFHANRWFPWVKFVVPEVPKAGFQHAMGLFASGWLLLIFVCGFLFSSSPGN